VLVSWSKRQINFGHSVIKCWFAVFGLDATRKKSFNFCGFVKIEWIFSRKGREANKANNITPTEKKNVQINPTPML
jgi:hypothetical protein